MARVEMNKTEARGVISGEVARTISDLIDDLKRLIIQSFGQVKTGRPGRFRRASAPGEAPAIQTGRLFRSLRESFPSPTVGELLIDTPYAAYLEIGTNRMDARPFVRPAIDDLKARFAAGRIGKFA